MTWCPYEALGNNCIGVKNTVTHIMTETVPSAVFQS